MVDPSTRVIDVDSLYKYFDNYLLIDSRTKAEYATSRLSGARHIHYKSDNAGLDQLPRDRKIVVYCSIGYRSDLLTKRLVGLGYDAINLYGGLFEWVNRDLPVFKWDKTHNQEERSQIVHPFNSLFGKWINNQNIITKGFILYD